MLVTLEFGGEMEAEVPEDTLSADPVCCFPEPASPGSYLPGKMEPADGSLSFSTKKK